PAEEGKPKCAVYWPEARQAIQPAEEGKPKCAVYWPEARQAIQLDTVNVEHIGEEETEFDTMLFRVNLNEPYKATANAISSEPLIVKQHRWSTWPDRGIPNHESAMVPLKLLSYVRETRAPCVVHCSAGIGRTGTVIAIEMGIRRFLEGKRVDLATVFLFFHSYNQFRLEVTSAIM
uniref:Protein-tyrosine phosphatase n=1 Tax=Ascaris lumbricoides TaxID=6252 RepID=A0A0M3IWW9_ASCLU